ncbi:MAG: hypothetical protein V1720_00825 [bacterium]
MSNWQNKIFTFALTSFLLFSSKVLFSQYGATASNSFLYPDTLHWSEYRDQLALYLAKLPEDIVEEVSADIYAPYFSYQARFGLIYGFALTGSVSTNIITRNFQLGLQWNLCLNRLAFSLGYDASLMYGKLRGFGFDNKVYSWIFYPNISAGFAFEKFTISCKAEAAFITKLAQYADDVESIIERNFLSGGSIGFYIEQPLWKDHIIILGVKGNYIRYYLPAWATFPTWDRYHFIPEAVIGINL